MSFLRAAWLSFLEQVNLHSDDSLVYICVSESVSVNCGQLLNTSVPLLSAWTLWKMTLFSCTWWIYDTREGSRTFLLHLTLGSVRRCFCFLTRKMFWKARSDNKCAAELEIFFCIDSWQKLSYLGRHQYHLFLDQVWVQVHVFATCQFWLWYWKELPT